MPVIRREIYTIFNALESEIAFNLVRKSRVRSIVECCNSWADDLLSSNICSIAEHRLLNDLPAVVEETTRDQAFLVRKLIRNYRDALLEVYPGLSRKHAKWQPHEPTNYGAEFEKALKDLFANLQKELLDIVKVQPISSQPSPVWGPAPPQQSPVPPPNEPQQPAHWMDRLKRWAKGMWHGPGDPKMRAYARAHGYKPDDYYSQYEQLELDRLDLLLDNLNEDASRDVINTLAKYEKQIYNLIGKTFGDNYEQWMKARAKQRGEYQTQRTQPPASRGTRLGQTPRPPELGDSGEEGTPTGGPEPPLGTPPSGAGTFSSDSYKRGTPNKNKEKKPEERGVLQSIFTKPTEPTSQTTEPAPSSGNGGDTGEAEEEDAFDVAVNRAKQQFGHGELPRPTRPEETPAPTPEPTALAPAPPASEPRPVVDKRQRTITSPDAMDSLILQLQGGMSPEDAAIHFGITEKDIAKILNYVAKIRKLGMPEENVGRAIVNQKIFEKPETTALKERKPNTSKKLKVIGTDDKQLVLRMPDGQEKKINASDVGEDMGIEIDGVHYTIGKTSLDRAANRLMRTAYWEKMPRDKKIDQIKKEYPDKNLVKELDNPGQQVRRAGDDYTIKLGEGNPEKVDEFIPGTQFGNEKPFDQYTFIRVKDQWYKVPIDDWYAISGEVKPKETRIDPDIQQAFGNKKFNF